MSGCTQLVIVAGGGRDLDWPPPQIAAHLLQATSGRLVQALFHGAGRGADQAIAAAAEQLGWPQIACPAAWQQFGRSAGPIRNRQMLVAALERVAALPQGCGLLVLGFPGANGTRSLLDQARAMAQRASSFPIAVLQIPAA
ncbi:hypothetical protein SynRS9909_01301 [Synechococcus sp. RS9909]|uniref:SLOG family protein n=1 Tax=unclassified Synechococcus TaxID=2626047 RepID=UPI0002EF4927|nr:MULTISPECIES: SLOG family protein [unclassified Synechococcus]QNI79288.1 hypothetical protein SynRS9909_01301 [Synechococcus sp. RS9909]